MANLPTRGLLVGLLTAVALSLLASAAAANHLSINERRFDAKWTALRYIAGGNTVACPLTLEGSFHYSTINKVENSLIGHISRASVGICTGGHSTVLTATLPWHVQFAGFGGSLPNITEVKVKVIGLSLALQPEGSVSCLMSTAAEHPAIFIGAANSSHELTSLTAESGAEIPLRGSLGLCNFAGGGHFEGQTTTLARLGTTTKISVTLI